MPIYEYRCLDCDRPFETLIRPGRDTAACPICCGANLSRELSVFASHSSSNGASEAACHTPANGARGCSGGGRCGGACRCG